MFVVEEPAQSHDLDPSNIFGMNWNTEGNPCGQIPKSGAKTETWFWNVISNYHIWLECWGVHIFFAIYCVSSSVLL